MDRCENAETRVMELEAQLKNIIEIDLPAFDACRCRVEDLETGIRKALDRPVASARR